MRNQTIMRSLGLLALPLLLLMLPGCSGQPGATTTDNQQAKEQEAQDKARAALQSDPTLQRPGTATAPVGAANVPPGAPLSPGPVPGGGR